MAIYLKKFETQAAYEAAESSLILPNVSLTVDNNTVHYNPSSPIPPTPSHDYVEIGGIKWATMNIGATGITDYGLYFQWGDTQGYTAAQVGSDKQFTWNDYKYTNDGGTTMTKYNETDGLVTLQASDDAVTAAWGGNWRTPTENEFTTLIDAVNIGWVSDYQDSGVAGIVCTDKTDNSKVLFFPVAGYCINGNSIFVGREGYYWSSSLNTYDDDIKSAIYLFIAEGGHTPFDEIYWEGRLRFHGCTVRGVLDE